MFFQLVLQNFVFFNVVKVFVCVENCYVFYIGKVVFFFLDFSVKVLVYFSFSVNYKGFFFVFDQVDVGVLFYFMEYNNVGWNFNWDEFVGKVFVGICIYYFIFRKGFEGGPCFYFGGSESPSGGMNFFIVLRCYKEMFINLVF